MYVLAVVGDGQTSEAADVLVEHLSDRARVGRVARARDPARRGGTPGPDATRDVDAVYSLSDDGRWRATGDGLFLDGALDRLAPTCEYAVVEGFSGVSLPTVVIGDTAQETGDTLVRVASVEQLDTGSVADALAAVDPHETLGSLVHRAKQSTDEAFAGAIATFTGRVRAKEHEDDDPTESLEFERYDGIAAEKMGTIRAELESREGVYEVLLHHRTGVVEAGEDIVFVVVLAGHRTEAFQTVEAGINRLKEEVPLFKKEITVNDEFWAHTGRPD